MTLPFTEKRLLQTIIAIGCLVPLSAGLAGIIFGASFLGDGNVNLDSHFRYLSGLLLGIGIGFLSTIPNIEHKSARFQLLTLIVVIGGIGRLVGVFLQGIPDNSMIAALGMELVITPLLCIWQYRVSAPGVAGMEL